jgi:hypothetical protein
MSIDNNRRHVFISQHHADDGEVSNPTGIGTEVAHAESHGSPL